MISSRVRQGAHVVVRAIARAAMAGWFRGVELHGTGAAPIEGPLLVVASHLNGFVDPALMYSVSPRPLRFLAKSTLWKNPVVGALLDVAGALPVHRAQDGATTGNTRIFESCEDALRDGGAIAIFPEGTTHDDLQLRPLRSGAARIALGAVGRGVRGIVILPVGLLYEDKGTPRTRALVRLGRPIQLDAELDRYVLEGEVAGDGNHLAVKRLTEELTARLREAAIDYSDPAEALALEGAARVALRNEHASPDAVESLAAVDAMTRRLGAAPAGSRSVVIEAIETYRAHLAITGLDDEDVLPSNTIEQVRRELVLARVKAICLAPLAAVGASLNVSPYVAVRIFTAQPLQQVSRGTFTLLASMIAYPLTWVAWALLGRRLGVRRAWLLSLIAGPLGGWAAVTLSETLGDAQRSALSWQRASNHEQALEALRAQRAAVCEAVNAAMTPRAVVAAPAGDASR